MFLKQKLEKMLILCGIRGLSWDLGASQGKNTYALLGGLKFNSSTGGGKRFAKTYPVDATHTHTHTHTLKYTHSSNQISPL